MRRLFRSHFDDDEPLPTIPPLPARVDDPVVAQVVEIVKVQDARVGRLGRAYERFGKRMVWILVGVTLAMCVALAMSTAAFLSVKDKQDQLDAQQEQTLSLSKRTATLSKENAQLIVRQVAERRRNTVTACISSDASNAALVTFLVSLVPPKQTPEQATQTAQFIALARKSFPTAVDPTSKTAAKQRRAYCENLAREKIAPAKTAKASRTG